METDDDSRSSSNSSASSVNSANSSNGPASPPQENENESNDQQETAAVASRSRSSSRGSIPEEANQSMSPSREQNASNENQSKDEEEEIELSDIDEESSKPKKADISHEDLSDISDLESNSPTNNFTDLRQKLENKRLNGSGNNDKNDEDELDFEDDEVREVSENPKKAPKALDETGEKPVKEDGEHKSDDGSLESGEELEDGEVTDGDDKRPEESEPKAVCRFFTRGQCTWGMSCRFLHPGTTDKGNYTMFDMVRPIPVPQSAPIIPPAYDYRIERPPIHHMPHAAFGHPRVPPVADSESAWERGLRTAKEMMRKANKRKEQDIDFDEKKMNLSGPPDEIEKDPYYVRGSPEALPTVSVKATPPYERIPRRPYDFSPPAKFARGAPAHFEEDPYGRVPRYRELPAHRMPHYEDDDLGKRRIRSNREVIVEKAEDWSDPWARKSRGSAGRERTRGRERSYSSNSSYSSTSASSRSHSSSESSGSPSAPRRKRYESNRSKERVATRKPIRAKSRSTSVKKRHSPIAGRPRALDKKAASPISLKRKKPISPPPARKVSSKKAKRNSSSGSGSSSGSESDSSYSSSTSSSKGKKKREKIVVERKPSTKVESTKKRVSPPKGEKKDKISSDKDAAAAKMKSTRREELLKQLKAVEDAIARKKSKI